MLKPRLTPRDLSRFRGVLDRTLTRLMPGYRPVVGQVPERGALLTTPVSHRGRQLGHLSLFLEEGARRALPEVENLLPGMLATALDVVCLHKALAVDRETGLMTRDRFLRRIARAADLGSARRPSLAEDEPPKLALALIEYAARPGQGPALTSLAGTLRELEGLAALGRLGDRRLGALFRAAGPEEARAALERVRALILERLPASGLVMAHALLQREPAADPGRLDRGEAARILMERADTALNFASGLRADVPVVGFGELLAERGRVVQVLPQERVVINLGSPMGAMPGQVFAVVSESGEPKGEITVFEAGEAYSLAHASGGRARRLTGGDRLVFSRMDWSLEPGEELETRAGLEREGFNRNLLRLAGTGRALTLCLARLDDHERLAAMAGPEEVSKRLELLTSLTLAPESGAPELMARWGPGSLALAWTGLEPAEARGRVEALVAALKDRAPLSAGLVHWPCEGLKAEGLTSAAQKALVEAAMTGPETVVEFGAQTLNISGDHLFDAGDLEGALEEYRQGLALDPPRPSRLNLLNSLGVCHGRLGDQAAAMAAFEEVALLDPDNLMGRFNIGRSHLIAGRLEEALEAFGAAEAIDPEDFQVLFNLGKTALELGDHQRALEALGRAAALKRRHGQVHRLLGRARLLSGDRAGALSAFKIAVKRDPDDAESLSALGALFLDSDNDQEVALSLFRRSVELDPTNSLFRRRLGTLLYQLGDYEAAERHLRLAVEYGCREEDVKERLASLATIEDEDDPEEAAART